MKNTEKFVVLDAIQKIYEKAENSELKLKVLQTFKELPFLMDFFSLNEIQTVLFSIIFVDCMDERRSRESIWKYLNMKNLDFLKFENEIETLVKNKLLLVQNRRNSLGIMVKNAYNRDFEINEYYLENIIQNKKITSINTTAVTFLEAMELFEQIKKQKENHQRNIRNEIELFFHENNFTTLKFIKKLNLQTYQQYFVLSAIWDTIEYADNDYNTDVQNTLNNFFGNRTKAFMQYRKMIKNQDDLTAKNLVIIGEGNFRGMCNCKLSDELIALMKKDGVEIDNTSQRNKENSKLLYHEKLPLKQLFYNPSEEQEIETMQNALQKEQFENLQKRLAEKAMPIGITALLYGSAGTGKTESVYQLAKKTGRNIYKVNISDIKSKWFGETEKLVKSIFTTYEELKKEEKECPILLFNEADGIIGKRKPAGSTNVADTENAVQNIFLEEIEKFDGILMATTNLVGNIDSAFERRFLYKIRFEKPNLENAKKIWQNKFSFLNENEAENLAKKLDFSGGEMENIARKILMNEVLNNEEPNYENILQMCGKERWNEGKKVGF